MKKNFRIEIEERAKIEISEAFDWCENQQSGLGVTFIEALQGAFITIQKSPNGYTKYRYHRQFLVTCFPYVILYEIVKDTMYIDAVFHTSRNPMNKIR
jgi:plasmid stabilization system protein ParE